MIYIYKSKLYMTISLSDGHSVAELPDKIPQYTVDERRHSVTRILVFTVILSDLTVKITPL